MLEQTLQVWFYDYKIWLFFFFFLYYYLLCVTWYEMDKNEKKVFDSLLLFISTNGLTKKIDK